MLLLDFTLFLLKTTCRFILLSGFFFRAGVSTVKSNSIKITSYQLATRLVSVVNLYSLINPIFCRKSPTFRCERRKSDATG